MEVLSEVSRPTFAAFFESNLSLCSFLTFIFVLFLVMIGLMTGQPKPLSRRKHRSGMWYMAKIHEIKIHDEFEAMLSDEQLEMFNNFISAASESEASIERIHYQQGMKDMFALIKALS